jgi:chromosome partitioning protein
MKTVETAQNIAFMNNKGGTCKTTMCINIAMALSLKGYKVAIIDTDKDQASMFWYCVQNEPRRFPVFGVIDKKALYQTIKAIRDEVDFIFLDTAGSLGEIEAEIAVISDMVIIPVQYSDEDQTTNILEMFKRLNERPSVHLLMTRIEANSNEEREFRDSLKSFNIPVFKSRMFNRLPVKRANKKKLTVFDAKIEKSIDEVNEIAEEVLLICQR